MVSSKRIGFFWSEEKITLVEFDKNTPQRVISSSLVSKTNTASPFNSSLTEEIQITAILQKMLKDNQIKDGSFYISLPMKDIILRSFIIPFVKTEEVENVIKYEAKKYMPFDIQDMAYVFYSIPFMENKVKRLQVIFFAARKDVFARYDRIFKQANTQVTYCEPYMVSLSKALLFRKDIKPTDHLAFLTIDNNLGCICFIDKGVPQFIREFSIITPMLSEELNVSRDSMNMKIVNEVGNSFDFYTRQFNGDRIEQMLISAESIEQSLLSAIENELKVKLTTFTPMVAGGLSGQNNDMDAVYAMGACVDSPLESLSEFNFLGKKVAKSRLKGDLLVALKYYQEVIVLFIMSVLVLIGAFVFFQGKLKVVQQQYMQLSLKQGEFLNVPTDKIEDESQQNVAQLNAYKNIRTKSDIVLIMLRVSSHLPQGSKLSQFDISYGSGDSVDVPVNIEIKGNVFAGDSIGQIAMVNQIYSDIKNDKELSKYFKNVNLLGLNRQVVNNQDTTGFEIHCS